MCFIAIKKFSIITSVALIIFLIYSTKVLWKDKKTQAASNNQLLGAKAEQKAITVKAATDAEIRAEDALHKNSKLALAAASASSTMKFHSSLHNNLYNFLTNNDNRKNAYAAAISLNSGSSDNTCVYFTCEVLRRVGMKIPRYIANTSQLLDKLQDDGWKKSIDYKELLPGDICFTTDPWLNKNGKPTHTYIFMGWVTEDNYDYAYVCDNQPKDYGGNIYHIRNITKKVKENGKIKEPFSFFMHK